MPAHASFLFNPHLESPEHLAAYVIRKELLAALMEEVHNQPEHQGLQHLLLQGRRGMGKTSLMLLLSYSVQADPTLSQLWLPIKFPEENYQLGDLADFWLETLRQLGEQQQNRHILEKTAQLQKQALNSGMGSDQLAKEALDYLLSLAQTLKKRFVLLIDNIDQVFEHIHTEQEQYALRKTLMEEGRILLIGGACGPLESTYRYDGAFYDFFRVYELENLSESEVEGFMRWKAQTDPDILPILDREPERLKALTQLTGGNPRMLHLIFRLFQERPLGEVQTDLETILDLVTPLYKHRIESLSKQMRQVFDALARHWEPQEAAEIAETLRLPVNQVSSQLLRLVKAGEVVKLSTGHKTTQYMVAERMYNLYYLMRSGRHGQARLNWFISFMRLMYSPQRLQRMASGYLNDMAGNCLSNPSQISPWDYVLSIAEAIQEPELRREVYHDSINTLIRTDIQTALGLDWDKIQTHLGSDQAERKRLILTAKETVLKTQTNWPDWDPQAFWDVLSVSMSLSWQEKLDIACRLKSLSKTQIRISFEMFNQEKANWIEIYTQQGFQTLCPHIQSGDLRYDTEDSSIDKIEYVQKNIEQFPDLHFYLAGLLSEDIPSVFTEKLSVLARQTLEYLMPHSPLNEYLWLFIGAIHHRYFSDYLEVEKAYLKAIECNQSYEDVWNNLGILYSEKLQRYPEAEKAYIKTIELNPNYKAAWNNLGNLYAEKLQRYDDAENAYFKAIKLSPNYKEAWNNLGILYTKHIPRYLEAEKAYLKALEFNQSYENVWINLGNLYAEKLQRYDKAEKAYLRAVEIKPNYAGSWNNLGILYSEKLELYPEAEKAYFTTIKINPNYEFAWNNLGNLYAEKLQRYDEAEKAYLRAVEIKPNYELVWLNLNNLFSHKLKQYAEAEKKLKLGLQHCPNSSLLLNELAWFLCCHTTQFSEAEDLILRALEQDPDNLYYLHTYLDILIKQNRLDEALLQLETLMKYGQGDYFDQTWADILNTWIQLMALGQALALLNLIEKSDLAEKWFPLKYALETEIQGTQRLKTLPPEIVSVVKELLDRVALARKSHNQEATLKTQTGIILK